MDSIKAVFFKSASDQLRGVTALELSDFVSYLNSTGDEGATFDAKDMAKVLDPKGRLTLDRVRLELAKHISAFANASGGMIILGLRENKNQPDRAHFELQESLLSGIDWQMFQRAVATSCEPRVEFSVEPVVISKKRGKEYGVILLFIEQGQNPPYQSVHNRIYYFRNGESSNPAPHSLVQALFKARKRPELSVNVVKTKLDHHLRVLIKNTGNAPAMNVQVVINIFPRLMKGRLILFNANNINETTDGILHIKSFLGSSQKNFMKFRLRADHAQVILPHLNETLFEFPFTEFKGAKVSIDVYCDDSSGHFEFNLS